MLDTTMRELLKPRNDYRLGKRIGLLSQPASSVIMDTLTAFIPVNAVNPDKNTADVGNLRTLFGFVYEAAYAAAYPDAISQMELEKDGITGTADFYHETTKTIVDTKCVASGVATKLKGQPRKGNPPQPNYLGYESQVKAYMYMVGAEHGELHVVDRGFLTKNVISVSKPTPAFWYETLAKGELVTDAIAALKSGKSANIHDMVLKAYYCQAWHPYSVYRPYGQFFIKGQYGAIESVVDDFVTVATATITSFYSTMKPNLGDYYHESLL